MPDAIQTSNIVRRRKTKHTSYALAISAEIGLEALLSKREDLQRDLSGLQVEILINSRRQMAIISSEEAKEFTNFFFDEVMGSQALIQVNIVIRSYSSPLPSGVDKSVVARAEKVSNDKECLPEIRDFFGAFSKAVQCEDGRRIFISQWPIVLRKLELFGNFEKLRQMAKDKHPDLLKFLAAKGKGYQTRRGVGWVSCTKRYLADSLDITENNLNITCQAVQGIAELVKHFGRGITLVIPHFTGDQ